MSEIIVIQKDELQILIEDAIKKVFDSQKLDKYANRQKFSPKEAAEFTNQKESHIRVLIRDNKIRYEKDGKLVVLFRKDLLPLKK